MPRVRIGVCYSLTNPESYEPKKRGGGKHERLYSFMMPSLGATGLPRLLSNPTYGRECIASFYQFVDLVARLPREVRWNAVRLDDDCWHAMDDFEIAEYLSIDDGQWKRHAVGLIFAGLLQKRVHEIDVGSTAEASRYERAVERVQLPLFASLAPIDSFDSSRALAHNELKERTKGTNRNETNGAPELSTTREPAGEARPSGHVSPEPPEAEGPAGLRSVCRSLVLSDRPAEACRAMGKLLAQQLCVEREPTPRDFEQWRTIFGRMWTQPGERRLVPSLAERADRIDAAATEALELSFREGVANRPAYFAAWAKRMGFLTGSGGKQRSGAL